CLLVISPCGMVLKCGPVLSFPLLLVSSLSLLSLQKDTWPVLSSSLLLVLLFHSLSVHSLLPLFYSYLGCVMTSSPLVNSFSPLLYSTSFSSSPPLLLSTSPRWTSPLLHPSMY